MRVAVGPHTLQQDSLVIVPARETSVTIDSVNLTQLFSYPTSAENSNFSLSFYAKKGTVVQYGAYKNGAQILVVPLGVVNQAFEMATCVSI